MDVNGSRFELLLGRDDWGRCEDAGGHRLDALWRGSVPGVLAPVDWADGRDELTLRPDIFRFPAAPSDRAPLPADRRGAGRDRYGSWYWIAPDGVGLLVQSAGTGTTSRFWPVDATPPQDAHRGAFGPAQPAPLPPAQPLAGAAVTTDHFLVAGTLGTPGLLVFDLQGGGAPSQLPWPDGIGFAPFDIAPRAGGGVLVLDAERSLVWELDRTFRIVPAAAPAPPGPAAGRFESLEGAPVTQPAAVAVTVSASDATACSGDPIAIEAAPGGGVLVLDHGDARGSIVTLYRGGVAVGAGARTEDPTLELHVTGHDMALVGDVLFVADAAGNQSYAFALALGPAGVALTLLRDYYPMRRFGGKGLVASERGPYYDFEDSWIPLARQPRARFLEGGEVVTPVFDAGEPSCVWHRLMLDARVGPGTSVEVWSAAADERDELDLAGWRREPDPQPRRGGTELPFVDNGRYDTHELLFQEATGRYLRLRLRLLGDGRATPRLRALRAWHPRFSYLERYLPAVYREDAASGSFTDRFLANFEGLYTEIEDRLAAAQVLFGPDTAPPETLDWLGGWFDLALDPLWDERRRRLLLRNASRFFQTRGTIRGIELMLRMTLDPCVGEGLFDEPRPPALAVPRIVEAYRTRRTPGVALGDPTELEQPRLVDASRRWRPSQGRDALNAGYAEHLTASGLPPAPFPIADPGGTEGAAWRVFSRAVLGFVAVPADPARWRAFLARRYANAGELGRAYGAAPRDFADVTPPTELPADGAPLLDWYAFASVVAPMAAKAHRFSVLLPWPLHVVDSRGVEVDHEELRKLARRVVELQKPAHTTFSVKFFWAAFRIGEARLGDDTLLASGSRVPELVRPAVLGREHLGETVLAGPVASDRVRRTFQPAAPEGPPTAEERS
jgi:phage tail-like protein